MARFSFASFTRPRIPRPAKLFVPLIALLLGAVIFFNSAIVPRAEALAVGSLTNRISSIISQTVLSVLEQNAYTYNDFIHISTKSDGEVSHLSLDSVTLNRALYQMTSAALEGLSPHRSEDVALPLGSLLGMEWWNGRGPDIPVRITLAHGIHACFRSEFATQGINQTLHTVYFSIKIKGELLLATRMLPVDLSQEIVAAQTVILGSVPDSFTHISRLTADVSEEEIDDIFDFGNQN